MKNQELAEENSKKIQDFEYYNSDAYKEKIAKQSFGLINPGEEVIIIPEKKNPPALTKDEEEKQHQDALDKSPNYKKWWLFFFTENPYK